MLAMFTRILFKIVSTILWTAIWYSIIWGSDKLLSKVRGLYLNWKRRKNLKLAV